MLCIRAIDLFRVKLYTCTWFAETQALKLKLSLGAGAKLNLGIRGEVVGSRRPEEAGHVPRGDLGINRVFGILRNFQDIDASLLATLGSTLKLALLGSCRRRRRHLLTTS